MVQQTTAVVNKNAPPTSSRGPEGRFRLEGSHVADRTTDFRTRLRHFGVTYQQVADRVGVSDTYISMIAIGRRPLTERIRVAADDLCREAAARKVAEAETLIGTLVQEQAGGGVGG